MYMSSTELLKLYIDKRQVAKLVKLFGVARGHKTVSGTLGSSNKEVDKTDNLMLLVLTADNLI